MPHMNHVPSIKCQCTKLDQYTDEIILADAVWIVKVFGQGRALKIGVRRQIDFPNVVMIHSDAAWCWGRIRCSDSYRQVDVALVGLTRAKWR